MNNYVEAQLPLLKLRRQEVPVAPEKQPTGSVKSTGRANMEDVHFFDPIYLFQTVLSSASFRTNCFCLTSFEKRFKKFNQIFLLKMPSIHKQRDAQIMKTWNTLETALHEVDPIRKTVSHNMFLFKSPTVINFNKHWRYILRQKAQPFDTV